MTPVVLEDTTYLHVGTSSATTGAATNADSTPTASIEEDGAAMGYSPAVANVATGLYRVTIVVTAANGFEAGKRYSVYVAATVGGVTGRDGIGEFECVARSLGDLAFPNVVGRGIDVDATGGVEITPGQNVNVTTIAADAVNASALATDAVTEIQAGLALSTQVDALEGDTTTLLARLTSARAGNLDNIDATFSARMIILEKLLRNKLITDPVTGIATLYDDDSTTPLITAQLYENAAGSQTYRGQGVERRQRFA